MSTDCDEHNKWASKYVDVDESSFDTMMIFDIFNESILSIVDNGSYSIVIHDYIP